MAEANILSQVEDSVMWKETNYVVAQIYDILSDLPDDEKWQTTFRLRSAANELLFVVTQALANSAPTRTEYEWSSARRAVHALKTMYRFAGRQKFIKVDPDIMLALDRIVKGVDKEVLNAYQRTKDFNKQELGMLQEYAALRKVGS